MDTTANLLSQLQNWVAAGALRPLDLALTRLIHDQTPEHDAAVLLAVALTSERNQHGHVCLDLAAALAHPHTLLRARHAPHADLTEVASGAVGDALAAQLATLTLAAWIERLAASGAIADQLHRNSTAPNATDNATPLVLAGTAERPLLYLRRYWTYEQQIRQGIAARLRTPLAVPEATTRRLLDALFVAECSDPPWQRIACALAARSAFAIITGGPGTGKTTTVVRLLALLQSLALESGGAAWRIRLAAPTGKAAARLTDSIAAQVAGLPFAHLPGGEAILRAAIPTTATTLHRLLGPLPDSRHFRYCAKQPLPAEIVVVDEASMIDVEMMAALLAALSPEARLILLGDQDQLASVEAGAVLGDLCQRARAAHYTPETSAWLARVSGAHLPDVFIDPAGQPLDQAITMLRQSYRFHAEGGIGALAELVNTQRLWQQPVRHPLGALKTLFAQQAQATDTSLGRLQQIVLRDATDPQLDQLARAGYAAPDGYLAVLHAQRPADDAPAEAFDAWARAVLEAQSRFQLLTPLRRGLWGVEGLNQRLQRLLSQGAGAPLADTRGQPWFEGRPVLVTRNDRDLNLMNGDIGLTLRVPERFDTAARAFLLRVAFPAGNGAIRWMLPSRLQAVETVFALTVHKSQGSEFEHTALVLPDTANPVLTRELLYTAITRSKSIFTLLYSRESVVREALEQQVERVTGLGMFE